MSSLATFYNEANLAAWPDVEAKTLKPEDLWQEFKPLSTGEPAPAMINRDYPRKVTGHKYNSTSMGGYSSDCISPPLKGKNRVALLRAANSSLATKTGAATPL